VCEFARTPPTVYTGPYGDITPAAPQRAVLRTSPILWRNHKCYFSYESSVGMVFPLLSALKKRAGAARIS